MKQRREMPGISLLCYLFSSRSCRGGIARLVNDIHRDLWFHLLCNLDGNHERPNAADRIWQVNHTPINSNTFYITQAFSNILTGDRAIQTAFSTNTRLK